MLEREVIVRREFIDRGLLNESVQYLRLRLSRTPRISLRQAILRKWKPQLRSASWVPIRKAALHQSGDAVQVVASDGRQSHVLVHLVLTDFVLFFQVFSHVCDTRLVAAIAEPAEDRRIVEM